MIETTEKKSSVKWILILLGVLFAGLLVFGYRNVNRPRPQVGEIAPDITLEFYEGHEWNGQASAQLSDLQGEIVVLNFWASWCPPCIVEAPELESVYRAYKEKGVTFIGVAWTDTERGANEFMDEHQISYPNAPDIQQKAKELYRFSQVPETYIIDRDGVITHAYLGELTAETISSAIEEVLQ